ncbi:MAG: hypothetical protein BWK73_52195 [Thiothrix lacustris]|uniref:Uncharacterized protein n=1 Tax=Thiothrix lacustris TaxID=525917 RepID=A0A1Y1Q7T4_9GAMM|nr:MAG: hypothetical protein BWK73_52195 [Thiothrix lacustris]
MLELKPEITYGDLMAAGIGVVVVLLLGMLSFIYTQILQSVDDRADLVASLRDGKVRRLYQGSVNWLLRGLQKLYGNKDSLQAFGVSFLLSYLYPFLFFILTYSYFDGTHRFSGKELLPADSPYRPYFFLIFPLFFTIVFFVNTVHVVEWGQTQLRRLGLRISEFGFQVGTNLFISVFSGVFAAATVTVSGGAFVVMSAFAAIFVSSSVFPGNITFYTILVAGSVVAGLNAWMGIYDVSLMFAFFYLALPLVNALLDWLSWWVSRFFLERTAQAPRVRVIVLDVVLDFGVAVLFMLALCLLLPAGAILLDSLYAGWVDVETGVPAETGWQEYAVWARDDPWGKGIMVTLMLVTTLIPTLLHILLGLMAFFIHGFKGAALADFLEQPRKNWRDAVASFWMFGYVLIAGLAMLALYQGLQHFIQLPIAQWLYHFTGYFYELP